MQCRATLRVVQGFAPPKNAKVPARTNWVTGVRFPKYLTDKGKELIEQAVFPHVENQKRLMEKLDLKTKTSLQYGLEKWLEVLEGSR